MPENRNFTKIHWSRACRTDKGVHAAANVISLKMNVLDNAAEAINAHLPQDIRVFDVYRVSKGFNSWKECTERRYEYSMPTYCLQPLQQYLSELIGFSEQQRAAFPEQYLPEIKMPDQSLLHPAASRYLSSFFFHSTSHRFFQIYLMLNSEGEGFNTALFCPSIIQRYAPFTSTFRLSEADKVRLNTLLHKYTGTHSFHNFTIRRKPTDSSTNRFIKEVKAVEYFMHDNVEFVRILVHGQSFMLHQIRKMVGFVCAIMRGLVPESEFDRVFDRKHLFIAPMAPAEGLFLDRCYFQKYNIKLTREKSMADRQPMTWDALDEQVELFKRQQIHPVILHQSHEQKVTSLI
jgi:tRNA pseudouridine38-40 synthase